MTVLLASLIFISSIGTAVKSIDKMKIHGLSNQPIVSGKLNGKKAYFLLDTGSDVTLLNLADAKKYQFDVRNSGYKKIRLSGLAKEYTGDYLTAGNIDLMLGNQKMKIKCRVMDLSTIINSVNHNSNMKICGIIGSDMMIKYNFVIDYKSREVRFDGSSSK